MLKVEETSLAILIENDLEGMMHNHWQEVVPELSFDPDWETAKEMEKDGTLKVFGLFKDGELIGYSAYELCGQLFFKSTLHAFNDAIYVKPKNRGFAGVFLVKQCEPMLKSLGVKRITYSSPFGSGLHRILDYLGYAPAEIMFDKVLI